MIRYALTCDKGHAFDSWFQSAAAFDTLARAGHLSCAVCGGGGVRKALMAPPVAAKAQETAPEDPVARMRREVEENATYVGGAFAQRAREMHEGIAEETSIYGEASGAEARKLIDDGIPILPLPFKPKRKMQ
ncbi:DUF1178 family protein [Sulfitobacter albidus]|uniref:DUF1178 family protein n=1 Tax=Sulfitobacter albidus TaxID=2829501 RepID=A0A975JBZ5_9RHOB|nr:DUF1178 family protein [Sulfitobacter albidus]QUJ75638.1 DUF1178 family protein [Sulfitobacter albidus]